MMHYKKGENVEEQLKKEDVPFKDCFAKTDSDFLWMHVRGGTKVANVLDFAKTSLNKGEHRSVVWTGYGGGVVKTVSCAEILKRHYPFYQVTRMCYTSAQEHWLPQMNGLEEIIVNRQIPCIHILLSLDPIDESISGVQKPNMKTDFWIHEQKNTNAGKRRPNNNNNNNNTNRPSGSQQIQQQQPPQQQRNPNKKNKSRNKRERLSNRPLAEGGAATTEAQENPNLDS